MAGRKKVSNIKKCGILKHIGVVAARRVGKAGIDGESRDNSCAEIHAASIDIKKPSSILNR